MNPDLTPIATEHAQLAAFKAQADALGWTPKQAVAVADPASVEALLDAQFRWAQVHDCRECGAVVARETEDVCYPCRAQNRRGDLYGGKTMRLRYQGQGRPVPYALEDEPPAPGDALRAVEAVWIDPSSCAECARRNERIDALLDQNDALAIENSDLARQVVNLKGAIETQSAAVRASKGGLDPLAVLQAEERVLDITREYETLRDTCTQQANRLAACRCGA